MERKYKEYKHLDLIRIAEEVNEFWQKNDIFNKSVTNRAGHTPFVFYEGPPSANGQPGIHHVMARAIKDIFCRYKTLKGHFVERKAGWDTHGLPIEIAVEKTLGITKEDIGKSISVEEYNAQCRKEVMKYKDQWDELTVKMGYWVDLEHPYITFENKYIETVWNLLAKLYEKGFLYKGYSIQPYSPAAGTGLSSHELNLPGCYKNVRDNTVVAQFKVVHDAKSEFLFNNQVKLDFDNEVQDVFILAWTTTPWTLPSNTALAVGAEIDYVRVLTHNRYSHKENYVICAAKLLDGLMFGTEVLDNPIHFKGKDLAGLQYEQLLPFVKIKGKAFEVVLDDFVTTEEGTGIVHIAPTFGADDKRVAEKNKIVPATVGNINKHLNDVIKGTAFPSEIEYKAFNAALVSGSTQSYIETLPYNNKLKKGLANYSWDDLGSLTWDDLNDITWNSISQDYILSASNDSTFSFINEREFEIAWENLRLGNTMPLVDLQGKFVKEMGEFAGRYVKSEYDPNFDSNTENNVDVDIIIKLKKENKAFKAEKYEHSYPHCWRTDKPILYYPLDSWFIKTTAVKDRMIELNKTINWKPESTGSGRFGNWLENLVDWNLSRSRYWGVPLPIWTTEDRSEQICIQSAGQLKKEIEKSIAAGFMTQNPYANFTEGDFTKGNYETIDLHRPYVDEIFLVSEGGKKMFREPDLIDVWFDSGAMPYAQCHYPFENMDFFKNNFPADFIAEGVDQTRGWFFTLHAIATMLFDSVAYKNVVSNGLVLDKNGNKMSKRLGNGVDPFETLGKYGPDATRWYMITNSQPWDNLKFDLEGIDETRRKLFGTLYNTYAFFALYANIDRFKYSETDIPLEKRPEIDRWIISELNTLVMQVDECLSDYEPTRAGRLIQDFVDEFLSNWYVRLCRRRFWKGEYSEDKISAYQTLYTCLETLSILASPISPFFMEKLFLDLNSITGRNSSESVHLTDFPKANASAIDKDLEERMQLAQKISSMILSLRKKHNLRVRQPLGKIMIPVMDEKVKAQIEAIKSLILSEVNIKEIEYIETGAGILVKKIKPNFKTLGPKYGKLMKQISAVVVEFDQDKINEIEKTGTAEFVIEGQTVLLDANDVEIITEDIPGWVISTSGNITVALDVTITQVLKEEGIARELINRIQNLRKDKHLEVTDRIIVEVEKHDDIVSAIENNYDYICSEILAASLSITKEIAEEKITVELTDEITTCITLKKA
jgi:isoleucyl-tRNA synthetase